MQFLPKEGTGLIVSLSLLPALSSWIIWTDETGPSLVCSNASRVGWGIWRNIYKQLVPGHPKLLRHESSAGEAGEATGQTPASECVVNPLRVHNYLSDHGRF